MIKVYKGWTGTFDLKLWNLSVYWKKMTMHAISQLELGFREWSQRANSFVLLFIYSFFPFSQKHPVEVTISWRYIKMIHQRKILGCDFETWKYTGDIFMGIGKTSSHCPLGIAHNYSHNIFKKPGLQGYKLWAENQHYGNLQILCNRNSLNSSSNLISSTFWRPACFYFW